MKIKISPTTYRIAISEYDYTASLELKVNPPDRTAVVENVVVEAPADTETTATTRILIIAMAMARDIGADSINIGDVSEDVVERLADSADAIGFAFDNDENGAFYDIA